MLSRAKKLVLLAVVSGAILAAMVWFVGPRQTAEAIVQAGLPAFLAIAALLAAVLLLNALGWAVLERAVGHRVPFRVLLEATVAGMAANILTPSTYLGGEPVKVVYVARKTGCPYVELASTVLLGKYLELLSFLLFVGGSTAVAATGYRGVLFEGGNLPLGLLVVAAAAGALVLCGAMWVSLKRQWTPLTVLAGLPLRLPIWRRAFQRLKRRAFQVELEASRIFRTEGPAVRPAFLFYVLEHVAIFLKPLAFFWLGWRTGLDVEELALIFLAGQVLLAVQVTPSGIGTLDGGMLGVLALAGIAITAPQCAAYLLCVRFWDAVVVGVGGMLAARVGVGFLTSAKPLSPDAADQEQS